MRIGTDVNLWTCRSEGYPQIEFAKTKLLKKGKLDKDHYVRVVTTNPECYDDNGRYKIGSGEAYHLDTLISFNDAKEIFDNQGDGIKKFCDFENCPIEFDNPNEYDLLSLISVLIPYCGLD